MAKTTTVKKETKIAEEGIGRVRGLKKELATARLDLMTGKVKDTSIFRKKRKEMARLLTADKIKKYEKNA